ncbi:uncharacterized protein LOC132740184 [Ruditapes philippinarum]|uniref:uncharacterized protein LOC132740184 n=1 Tax=Ruditapes philippinarum TaxID=129788 RepID=UPI00295B0FC8|nr:uncharacterized protein LOC132740184 [Ruditapes philippinarum]
MDELEAALRIARTNPTPKDIENIKNGLGNPEKITYEQFEKVVEDINNVDQVKELKEAFQCFDKENLGYISPETLKEIVKPMIGEELPADELQHMIELADLDGDGNIDIDEFVAFMMQESE